MTPIAAQGLAPLDPDIYSWCHPERLHRLRSELLPAMRSLLWSQHFHAVVLAWVRKELIEEALRSDMLWTEAERRQRLMDARKRWATTHAADAVPPCDPVDVDSWLLSEDVLAVWTRQQWEHRLETLYLAQKQQLDFVTCSLLRVKNQALAFELALRLKAKEASFEQLSWTYGEGPERRQGGRFIHQRLLNLPQPLHPLLRKLKSGEVLKPHQLGDWFVIVSLDELVPAPFDSTTQAYLLEVELKIWLKAVRDHLVAQLQSHKP